MSQDNNRCYTKGNTMQKQEIINVDNFAKEYWESFENLTLSLLRRKLGSENNYNFYSHKTPSQNDGGYDGIIIIEPKIKLFDDIRELYTILTESKLRKNANKDLPLSDFAKTLIIAINRNAMEVYVYTNLHFSSETYKRISQFSMATSLKVKLIDIFEICDELENFPEIKKDFSTDFINSLYKASAYHNREKRIQYSQENMFTNVLPELTGDVRNELLTQYVHILKENTGVCIISGIQGTGKSLLMKHIINYLQFNMNCRIIQLEKFTTIKAFFIHMLSLIWNVDTIDIYNLTEDTLDEIALYLPEQRMSKHVKSVLLSILSDTPTEYENRYDVFEEHLLEYLYYIFTPICRRKKQLFAFTNFEKCRENILNFTNKLIRKFSSENVIILAELRTDIPYLKAYIDEWKLLSPNIKPIALSEFSYIEYIDYMQNEHPDMSFKQINSLYNICFPIPIYIENTLSFINENELEKLLSKEELNIKKLYNNKKFREKCITFSLEHFFEFQNTYCKKLAYIIGFFDGELSIENINLLGSNYQLAIPILADSIYFDIEGNNLVVHHMLYLKAFQNNELLNGFEYNEIVQLLYNTINHFQLDVETKELKKFELAIEYLQKDVVSANWKILCENLIRQNDFSFAKKLLLKIIKKKLLNDKEKLLLINKIIKCYLGLNEYKSQDLSCYINLGNEVYRTCSNQQEMVLFNFLKAKYFFSSGRYQDIMSLTSSHRSQSPELRYIRALSIKHIYGIDACLLSLSRGIKHFPEDWHLKYSYLDHMHSKYEKIDFEKSWKFLVQIEQYIDKLSVEDNVHYQYNKITLEMYKTKSMNIELCKELLFKTFENILPVEEGRIHNLMGQIYFIMNDLESAIKEFKKSLDILNRHRHVTYIYIPVTNLSLVYAQKKDDNLCLHFIKKTLDYLLQYKRGKINRQLLEFNKNIIIEKECASFIVVMEMLKKLDQKLFKHYSNKFSAYDLNLHSSAKLSQYYHLKGKITFRC